jgi:hypothetical protein
MVAAMDLTMAWWHPFFEMKKPTELGPWAFGIAKIG